MLSQVMGMAARIARAGRGTDDMGQERRLEELGRLDMLMDWVTEEIGIRAGPLCRMAGQYLHNWTGRHMGGMGISLDLAAEESYRSEWKHGGAKLDRAICNALRSAGLEDGNGELNRLVAEEAVSIMLSMHDGKRVVRVCDAGAGTGMTTLAFLGRLTEVMGQDEARGFARRFLDIRMLEPSIARLAEAGLGLERCGIRPRAWELCGRTLETHFGEAREGSVDMVISSAAFHHMRSTGYLYGIYNALSEGGVLVAGDWHHTLFSHPAHILPLLDARGADEKKIREFMRVFRVGEDEARGPEAAVAPSGRADNAAALRYLCALAWEMKAAGANFMFLEATESFAERRRKMEAARFEADMGELRRKHRGFVRMESNVRRVFPGRDLANVVCVAKIPLFRSGRASWG